MSEYYAFKNNRTGADFDAYPRRQISANENREGEE